MAKPVQRGKSAPSMSKDAPYKDELVEGFDAEADAFAGGGGRPPDDGKHFFTFRAPKKAERNKIRRIDWQSEDRKTGKKTPVVDFSFDFEAEIVDKDDPDKGKRVFGSIGTFVREVKGVKTYAAATVLHKLGIKPTGYKERDIKKLFELLQKGFELYGITRWVAELKYDEKGDEDYKMRQKVPLARGQNNFPQDANGNPIPWEQIEEDYTDTIKVKGQEREVTYYKGEEVRTYAEIIRYENQADQE